MVFAKDMSEYMEKFAVSRLTGAPPGYVGYEASRLKEALDCHVYTIHKYIYIYKYTLPRDFVLCMECYKMILCSMFIWQSVYVPYTVYIYSITLYSNDIVNSIAELNIIE